MTDQAMQPFDYRKYSLKAFDKGELVFDFHHRPKNEKVPLIDF